MPPREHALLSASAAHRWLQCTAAPRLEAQMANDGDSPYAAEGTLAHALAELKVRAKYCGLSKRSYNAQKRKIEADPMYAPEMERTTDAYLDVVAELVMGYPNVPAVDPEIKLDLSEWVPEGFGTSDLVIAGDGVLTVVDYKHGRGVPVSACNNPQMRLYALGAMRIYDPVYGPFETVQMVIVQPRVSDSADAEIISADELREWGERVKPIAQAAYTGEGAELNPGEHCRFCACRAVCRARADGFSALQDFAEKIPEGRVEADTLDGDPASSILRDNEIGDVLHMAEHLESWYKDLKEYALQRLLAGYAIPGYKLVEGRSVRQITDTDALLDVLEVQGYPRAVTTDVRPKTLTELEKLVGKKAFARIADGLIVKPQGAPTLAPEADPRPVYESAETDFKE